MYMGSIQLEMVMEFADCKLRSIEWSKWCAIRPAGQNAIIAGTNAGGILDEIRYGWDRGESLRADFDVEFDLSRLPCERTHHCDLSFESRHTA